MTAIKRSFDNHLTSWRMSERRKPLLIRGARQVGKSFSVKELGKSFTNFISINFEKQPEYRLLFQNEINVKKIIENISLISGIPIIPGQSLLFFDEIQEVPEAITALRYFYEEMPTLHVIAAGSLLEFVIEKHGLPVGRVQTAYMHPLSFYEFLNAIGKDRIVKKIQEASLSIALDELVHKNILEDFKTFALIGGMPEVIREYIAHDSISIAFEVITEIVNSYKIDILKYTKNSRVGLVNQVFNSIPLMVGRKFKYSNVSRDVQAKTISESLEVLTSAGIAHKVYHSSGNGIPLGAEAHLQHFKVISLDSGLMNKVLGFDLKLFSQFSFDDFIHRGNLFEQVVGNELIKSKDPSESPELYYWHREARTSNAEVDYLWISQNKIFPIEVKSGQAGTLKSMRQFFIDKKDSSFGVRISSGNFDKKEIKSPNDYTGVRVLFSIPGYAVQKVNGII